MNDKSFLTIFSHGHSAIQGEVPMVVQGENLRALVLTIGGAFSHLLFHLGQNTSAGGIPKSPQAQRIIVT